MKLRHLMTAALGAVALFATFGVGPDRVTAGDVVPAAIAAPVQ